MKQQTHAKKGIALVLALVLALALAVPSLAAENAEKQKALTRGELVLALYGLDGKGEAPAQEFSDVPADTELTAAVGWAASVGVVKGYGDGRFGPDDQVTREQMAAMLYRYAQSKGQGFQGSWMFLLDYPDAAEISEYADEAMHWVVMHEIITGTDKGLEPQALSTQEQLELILERYQAVLAEEKAEEKGEEQTDEKGEDLVLENDGLKLTIPAEFAGALLTETPTAEAEGMLFSVSEKASVEAAKARGVEEDAGPGWLFGIGRVGEAKMQEMLCNDMSGAHLFATDGKGTYYLLYHPTDVRIERSGELTEADMEQWTKLNELGPYVQDGFIKDNGLTAFTRGNSAVEIYLYRLCYQEDVKYELTFLTHGALSPEGVDKTPYLTKLLDGVSVRYVSEDEDVGMDTDGEYLIINFPEEETSLRFFRSGKNYVCIANGETETLFKLAYETGETVSSEVVQEWYDALAAAAEKE